MEGAVPATGMRGPEPTDSGQRCLDGEGSDRPPFRSLSVAGGHGGHPYPIGRWKETGSP